MLCLGNGRRHEPSRAVDLNSYIRRLDHMYDLGGNFARETGPKVDWVQTSTVAGSRLGTYRSAGGLPMDGRD
jgi:hypothetical protein